MGVGEETRGSLAKTKGYVGVLVQARGRVSMALGKLALALAMRGRRPL